MQNETLEKQGEIAPLISTGNSINYNTQEQHLEPRILDEENLLTIKGVASTTIRPLTVWLAAKEVLSHSLIFAFSRLPVSINNITNVIVLRQFGKDAIVAGPLIATMQYLVVGTMRGALLSSGIVIGELNGAGEKEKISDEISRGWVFGTFLSIPAIGILLFSGKLMRLIGVAEGVSACVEIYFFPFIFGIPPTYWLATDQQFALGIKKSRVTLVTGISYASLSILLGCLFALGPGFIPKLKVAGLGLGPTISAWLTLIGLRIYYAANSEYRNYGIFQIKFANIFKNFSRLLLLSIPMGLQVLSEWGNLFALATISGVISVNILDAAEPSLQIMVSYNLFLLGLAQASAVLGANYVGKIRKSVTECDENAATIHHRNLRMISNIELALAVSITSILSALFFSIPQQLTALLNKDVSEDILILSQSFFIINGIGILLDTIRNMTAGSLGSLKDVYFSPLVSFLTMSVIGLSCGGGWTVLLDWGAGWLFITRDIGIILAAIAIILRWIKNGSLEVIRDNINKQQEEKNIANKYLAGRDAVFSNGCKRKAMNLNDGKQINSITIEQRKIHFGNN